MCIQNQYTKLSCISNKAATICYKTSFTSATYNINKNKQKYVHILQQPMSKCNQDVSICSTFWIKDPIS